MKKTFPLLFIGWTACCYGQEIGIESEAPIREPFMKFYLTGSPGFGIPGQSPVIKDGPLMGQATFPLRFRHNWYLIPEAYGGAFRSPKFPKKEGFFWPTFPRYRHQLYGIRLGRSFAPPDNGFSILPSVGIDYLQTQEPYYLQGSGRLGLDLEYNTCRLYSIPIQVDLRFQKKRESYAAFAIGMRYNKNDRRSFGSLSAGVEFYSGQSYGR